MKNKKKFQQEYFELCEKYNLMIKFADECEYYVDEVDGYDLEKQITS